jgi:threonine/homoserine/homoserine lactone efflux protein
MTPDLFLALLAFAFVTSVTPGPNNLMLLASGANYGFRRSLPHMFGVSAGFMVLTFAAGFGLMGLFRLVPATLAAAKIAAAAYFAWLAWKIATSAPPADGAPSGRPLTVLQAAAFQWVNPKALAMALGAISAYAPGENPVAVAIVAAVFAAVNLPTISLWVLMGRELRRWLNRPARLRAFNWTMAALLLASLVPVLRALPGPG